MRPEKGEQRKERRSVYKGEDRKEEKEARRRGEEDEREVSGSAESK